LREESSINSRGQNTLRGERSCAESEAGEAARARERQAAAASQTEAGESDATEDEGLKRQEKERREWDVDREVA